MLFVSMLSACSGQNENVVKEQQQTPIKSVKKNESVNLPVNIFKDSKYEIEMQKVGFTRSITNVEMKDFDQSSELDLRDRYNEYVSNKNLNLKKDFKLLIINMKHEIHEKARSKSHEGYLLNKGSGLVIGDNEIASQNEFLAYQQKYITTDWRAKMTSEQTGKLLLAIPNEYAKNKSLQLKLVQKIDGENKLVYIDLN
ncbi:hypothetical protein CN325_26395 [Bacillus thuringiensis]|nr:hypothetical protein CN400_26340 [Bacillus thuringiensis]PFB40372.1 hypothetical protein CN396_27110 [Bacillus thuringiensis]PFE84831.1 hypothetical protein CN321_29040 [Bacillus thuringiensis]PFE90886.1 hypothetical protein CN325_26395 [Bacillus thuringiensis]PFV37967.1 hypothetical protein COL03_30420 [Bacillus thuringiensis]